ncbi:hypothetical protein GCM10010168_11450 [Actinoplanes ianthinogenes]|uniref:Uncharacterized protein n=1 Tax=Actinoplanes ianthinogenes TaxID=122358 RepID=A0ABM7LYD7_9ACTN|nr:hypothetical protein Aiant_49890 [Actinoplanes ianthinogenes]GGQ97333.1 hypothetical protein GCM10010168_11450 [Actinoplanes ianthinogenes]
MLATTATAAAVIGAGQLGIAYGLGIVRLDRVLDITARNNWTAQLAWVAWITTTAAALGALIATGMRPRWRPRPVGPGGALAMGIAAGVGALAVLPLTMQPARAAQVAGVQPVFVIGAAVGLGAAAGIFAAWATAAKPVARWSAATLSVLIWLVALISIGPSLLPGRTPIAIRLGVLNGSLIPPAVAGHTAFLTMPTLALLAGLVVGWVARGRKLSTLAVGLSGLAGPALLTMAYLISGPETGGTGFQSDPYWAAMTACGAGVLGSVLAAIVRSAPGTDTAAETAADPAPAPLPKRDAPAASAIAQAAAAAAQRPEEQLRPSDTGVLPVPGTPNNPFSAGTGSPFRSGAPFPAEPIPTQARPQAPAPTQTAPQAPPPGNPPRFSGQQPKPAPGGRSGWRSQRSSAPAPAPAPAAERFDGFAAGQPVTASHGPLVEPTSISGPARRPGSETDYVDWVSGLGGQ